MLNLRLNSRPDSARLVRAVLGGVATPFALRPELVNDLKTVVSEACNNAVDHGYRGESGAIAVRVDIQLEEIEATVRDWGGGFQELAAAGDHLRVGLPLINALADRAQFLTAPGSGTEVRMGFDLRHDPRRTEMLVRLELPRQLLDHRPRSAVRVDDRPAQARQWRAASGGRDFRSRCARGRARG